jgi:predicted branched-subunit amino acid permease
VRTDDAARRAWREGTGVAIATSAYGISFGALAVASGLDVWQTCVLSLVMFTGGSQFAFIGVIGAGGGGGTRGDRLGGPARRPQCRLRAADGPGRRHGRVTRALGPHVTIDESTAVALAHTEPRRASASGSRASASTSAGTSPPLLGAARATCSATRSYGLDAAAAAAFLALLWPRLRRRQAIAVGVAAAVVATALTPVLMPGIPVLIAALVAVVVGGTNWLGRREAPGAGSGRRSRARRPAVTLWTAVLAASLLCMALKALGYLIPARWFDAPAPSRIVDLLTVALLGALVAVQTLGVGQQIVVDARVPALVAAGLLVVRAPFLVVVVAAAVVAALLRLWGLAA